MIKLHILSMKRERWDVYYEVGPKLRLLVSSSKNPECDGARALLNLGIKGKVEAYRQDQAYMTFDIETMAGLTVLENAASGPRFVKWVPFDGL